MERADRSSLKKPILMSDINTQDIAEESWKSCGQNIIKFSKLIIANGKFLSNQNYN